MLAAEEGIASQTGWEFAWWVLIVVGLLAWAVIRRWRPFPPPQPREDDEE